MQTMPLIKREYVFLLIAAIAVGSLSARMGSVVVFAILGLCALVFTAYLSPMQLFLAWLFLSPFTQTQMISLGGSIPDITFDRLLFLLLLGKLGIQALNHKLSSVKFELEDGLLIAFLAWALFSILFWKPVDLSKQVVVLFQQFIYPIGFYWIVQQVVTREADLKRIFVTVTILLFILCVPVPFEAVTGITPLGGRAQNIDSVIRVQSFLRSAWEFGAVAALMLMYNLHPLTYPSGAKLKTISWLGLLLGVLGIVFCFLRGAWLAAFISVSLLFGLTKSLRKYLYLAAPAIALAAIIWGPALMASDVWAERIAGANNITGRLTISSQQIDSILQEPFLGNGLMPEFVRYNVKTLYYDKGFSYTQDIISHNTALSMFVDFGMFALLYFGAIGVILFKAMIHYKFFPPQSFVGRGLLLSLGGAALAFLVNALTFENRLFMFLGAFFWVTLGLIKVAIRLNEERSQTASVEEQAA